MARTSTKPSGGAQPPTLHSRAMLCYLKVKMPSLGKTDKIATEEISKAHGVSSDMGKYRKNLYPKESLAKIQTVISAAKAHHMMTTLPWLDRGGRILPSANYLAHSHKINEFKIEFQDGVREFVTDYTRYLAESARLLGTLFDPADYPDPSQIGSLFSLECRYSNIPSSKDFRVDVSNEAAAAIRAQMDVDDQVAVQEAMRDCWDRVYKVTKHMVDSLYSYQPGGVDAHGNKRRAVNAFHSSLVDNVRQLADVLPTLNVGEDPQLDNIVKSLREDLCVFDADELKADPDMRQDVASKAAQILENVSHFLA